VSGKHWTCTRIWGFIHFYDFAGTMPLTNKEKMSRRRAKVKADPELYRERKEKDRQRKQLARAASKQKMSRAEWLRYRAIKNARIQSYRHQKRTQDPAEIPVESPYRPAQAMGKAVKRVRSSLPCSPRKRKAVAAALAKEVGLKGQLPNLKCTGNQCLDEETQGKVVDFYLRDDISWQAPGRKDHVIIRNKDGQGRKTKTYVQSKYMLMSLAEAHKLFTTEHADSSVSRSKFCELRPKHVKLFETLPHNVCVYVP